MVELCLIAGREFLGLVGVWRAAEIDPTVAAPAGGVADARLGVQLEVLELLERGNVTLSAVAGEDAVNDLPLGSVFETVS